MGVTTPYTSHLRQPEFRSVYEPSEDTFLLLDALEADQSLLVKLNPLSVLEIGVGSGIVLSFIDAVLGHSKSTAYFGTDMNPACLKSLGRTFAANNESKLAEPVLTNLAGGFRPCMFDLIVFNPPYVVSDLDEVGDAFYLAYSGGKDGRLVIDEFLFDRLEKLGIIPLDQQAIADSVPNSDLGSSALTTIDERAVKIAIYLVVIEQNKPLELMQLMSKKYGFTCCNVMSRKCGPEQLSILRFLLYH
ncbi:HemK methyltransferase family member 2 [Smittium culicis]|uniref:HemK methyltransferase family member 2 n=1 Tax=Smittium culicis TaxID=133412 RepID=A0A1R1XKG2_9FUNG|nr:HemK methyltransferase family member 2 [Smittium culicis]